MEPTGNDNEERDYPDDPEETQDIEREWLGDHPELAPDESRISVVTGEDLKKESVRRMANTGDIVDDAGDAASGAGPLPELVFDRSTDYMGSEANVAETGEFTRDLGERAQVTATQAFGRDIGISGLPGIASDAAEADNRPARSNHSSDWTAVLGRLGGSSPGSEENLHLAEMFASVRFPATREDVLHGLPAASEFHVRSVSVDLREAIAESSSPSFRNLYDLIEAVKDGIRRAEKRHPA